MAVTKDELDRFGRFAVNELARGSATSLEELVSLWRTRQREDVIDAIRQGLDEADAGLGRPLEDFMSEFRENNQVSPDA